MQITDSSIPCTTNARCLQRSMDSLVEPWIAHGDLRKGNKEAAITLRLGELQLHVQRGTRRNAGRFERISSRVAQHSVSDHSAHCYFSTERNRAIRIWIVCTWSFCGCRRNELKGFLSIPPGASYSEVPSLKVDTAVHLKRNLRGERNSCYLEIFADDTECPI